MASTQRGDSVPMLTASDDEMPTKSSTSSTAWTIAGEAPSARSTFAESVIAT